MKVKSYIALLSIVSLVGASLLIGLGWWAFSDLAKATRLLDEETAEPVSPRSNTRAFMLFSTRQESVFTSLDIYPERYSGLFGVTRDELSLAQKQLNHIAANYSNHYPEEVLEPVRRDLAKTEKAILDLEEFAFDADDLKPGQKKDFWQKRNQTKIEYETVRDELKRSLENIEIESEKYRAQSEKEVSNKWEALKGQEDRNAFFSFWELDSISF